MPNVVSTELNVKKTSHLIKILSVFTLTLYIIRICMAYISDLKMNSLCSTTF